MSTNEPDYDAKSYVTPFKDKLQVLNTNVGQFEGVNTLITSSKSC